MRLALFILYLTVWWLPAARADDIDRRVQARTAFELGQAAERQGEWEIAIAHYTRANDLVPHHHAMYNIAQNHERLGQLRQAAEWYERYLASAPSSPDRKRVLRIVRDLAARPGMLTVRSSPEGARVLLDQKAVGTTPLETMLSAGNHRVTIELAGSVEHRDVVSQYGEPVMIDVALERARGALAITGSPLGAAVLIDGKPAGRLPLRYEVAPGKYEVRVMHPWHKTFVTTATVRGTEEVPVAAHLTLVESGSLTTSVPASGYFAGGGAGVDVNQAAWLYSVELGWRLYALDLAFRLGRAGEASAYEAVIRGSFGSAWMKPFVSLLFSRVLTADGRSGGGTAVTGGLRLDWGTRVGTSLLLEVGARYVGLSGDDPTQLSIPVMASLVLFYR